MIIETKKGKLPVRYGMNALSKYGDMTGKTMNEVMKSMGSFKELSISELLIFVYVGFVDGARWAKEECKIASIEEVGDMIDEDGQLITKMFEVFNEGAEDGKSKKK